MTAAASDMPVPPAERTGLIGKVGGVTTGAVKFAIGVLMCLTPVTAIIALGWLTRKTAGDIRQAFFSNTAQADPNLPRSWPNWIRGDKASGKTGVSRWFGGLRDNLSAGVGTLAGLGILTLPFGALWLLSWWAGWENSFNKGYEQAWVGPAVALIGVGFALVTLMHLPLAMAHQAQESSWRAALDLKRVRALLRYSGWGYVGIAILYALAALPLFAVKGAPVFMEDIYPPITRFDPEQMRAFANGYHFWATVYLFVAVLFIRSRAARVYARAAIAACHANPQSWAGTAAADLVSALKLDRNAETTKKPGRLGRAIRGGLIIALWLFFVAQIFVGQFLNHSWQAWVNQPLFLLPWIPHPG